MIKDPTELFIMVMSQDPYLTEAAFLESPYWVRGGTLEKGEATAHLLTRIISGKKIDLTHGFDAQGRIVRVSWEAMFANEDSITPLFCMLESMIQKRVRCPYATDYKRSYWGNCGLYRQVWKHKPHQRIELESIQPVARKPARRFTFRHMFSQPGAAHRETTRLEDLFI